MLCSSAHGGVGGFVRRYYDHLAILVWNRLYGSQPERRIADYQNIVLISSDVWEVQWTPDSNGNQLGAIAAIAGEGWRRALLVVLLACAIFVVPVAQIHSTTAVSMDKHLAYGLWFGAMAAAYGFSGLIRALFTNRRSLMALCCAIAFTYPAVIGWENAWVYLPFLAQCYLVH